MILVAIAPRLAIKIFLNMVSSSQGVGRPTEKPACFKSSQNTLLLFVLSIPDV